MYRLHVPDVGPKLRAADVFLLVTLQKILHKKFVPLILRSTYHVTTLVKWFGIYRRQIDRTTFVFFTLLSRNIRITVKKNCTFIGYNLPYKTSWPLSKSQATSHSNIRACAILLLPIARNRRYGNCVTSYGIMYIVMFTTMARVDTDTPTGTHRHNHRPTRTREHKTHTTCLEKNYFFNFKKDFRNVRMALTWTGDGLQRLIPHYDS